MVHINLRKEIDVLDKEREGILIQCAIKVLNELEKLFLDIELN